MELKQQSLLWYSIKIHDVEKFGKTNYKMIWLSIGFNKDKRLHGTWDKSNKDWKKTKFGGSSCMQYNSSTRSWKSFQDHNLVKCDLHQFHKKKLDVHKDKEVNNLRNSIEVV